MCFDDDIGLAVLNAFLKLQSDIQSEGFGHDIDVKRIIEDYQNHERLSDPDVRSPSLDLAGISDAEVESLIADCKYDEWVNDDDNGFFVVNISTEEFFEMEEECAGRVALEEDLRRRNDRSGKAATVGTDLSHVNDEADPLTTSKSDDYADLSKDMETAANLLQSVSLKGSSVSQVSDSGPPSGPASQKLDQEGGSVFEGGLSKKTQLTDDGYDQDGSMTGGADSMVTVNENDNEPDDMSIEDTLTQATSSGLVLKESRAEIRRKEIIGQSNFVGADKKMHSYFNLKVIFEPFKTGFEEVKHFNPAKGTIIAGRYEVADTLGQAAFSTALQCLDLIAEESEPQWVCLKVIKNNKDYFDQSMDEIKLLQYINSHGDPDTNHVLRLIDFFYHKEHLFIVAELLRENLYEFGRYVREEKLEPYYTIPRLKKIVKQILEALAFVHSLNLIHCDVKPENILIKSYSRCEVKLIDFGSSCFTSDNLTTYIQSRSYRAPEVIIGHDYDGRIDIWSIGAVLAELYTGYVLFQNDSVPTMLARIEGILGPTPHEVFSRSKEAYKYYTSSLTVYEKAEEQSVALIFPKKTSLWSRLHIEKDSATVDEALLVDFIQVLLNLDPIKRVTAKEALMHKWLEGTDLLVIPPPRLTPPPAPDSTN